MHFRQKFLSLFFIFLGTKNATNLGYLVSQPILLPLPFSINSTELARAVEIWNYNAFLNNQHRVRTITMITEYHILIDQASKHIVDLQDRRKNEYPSQRTVSLCDEIINAYFTTKNMFLNTSLSVPMEFSNQINEINVSTKIIGDFLYEIIQKRGSPKLKTTLNETLRKYNNNYVPQPSTQVGN